MASRVAEKLVDDLVDTCFYCEIDHKADYEKCRRALIEYIEILEKMANK